MADLLALGEVDFLHLGCNQFATPPNVPPLFWWQAPSGRRVLTQYDKGGYGSGIVPPENWPLSAWMVFACTQDNGLPASPAEIRALMAAVRRAHPGAEVATGTLEDVRNLYISLAREQVETVTQDLADTWIHGIGSYPAEVSAVRRLRERIREVEIALTAAAISPDAQARAAALTNIVRENRALFAEHTWGLDVKTWLGPIPSYAPEVFLEYRKRERCRQMERSWDDQRRLAAKAEQACADCETLLGIPAPGSEAVRWTATAPGRVESACWRLAYRPETGMITGLYHKKLDAWILGASAETAIGYRYDVYGSEDMTEYLRAYAYRFSAWGVSDNGRVDYPECPHGTFYPAFDGITVTDESVAFHYRTSGSDAEYGNARAVTLDFAPQKDDALGITVTLTGKHATPYVESGALCLSFACEKPERWYINKTGEVLDPACDIAEGANHVFYALERFAALKTNTWIARVETRDAPLLSLGENGVFHYRRQYRPGAAEMRFCLFNNMWGTNFPQWIDTDASYTFRIRAFPPDMGDVLYERTADAKAPFALPQGVELTETRQTEQGWEMLLHHLRPGGRSIAVHWPGYLLSESVSGCFTDTLAISLRPFGYQTIFAQKDHASGKGKTEIN